MNGPLASPATLALVLALTPAAEIFGQGSQEVLPRGQRVAQDQTQAPRILRDAQIQRWERPWPGANPFWRNRLVDPSSQNLTFAWFDAASRNSGMTLAPADPALRAHLNLPKDTGLIVTALEHGSPAFAAGIRQNDILIRIAEVNSRSGSLGTPQDLEEGLKAVGDHPATLFVLRGGKRISLKVQPRVRVSLGPVHPEPPTYWIGVSVTPIEPALRSQLQLPDKQGLIAMEVVEDGPAAKAGLRRYDILLKFDGVDLTDQAGLTKLVQARGEKAVALELFRAGQKQEIKITPERRKTPVTFQLSEPQTAGFDIVLPGGVLSGLDAGARQVLSGAGDQPSAGESTEQRLDEISAQIKELQKILETLSKAQEKK